MLLINSPFAAAISFIFLKFLACAYEIFVMTPIFGFKILLKKSISPFLSIPISKTPFLFLVLRLNKLNGTPYLLL